MKDGVCHAVDAACVLAIGGVIAGILPAIATALAIAWYAIQIIDWYRRKK